MGVPGFFKWLIKKYKNENFILTNNNNILYNIDYLMIDTNSLIHPKCRQVFEKNKSLSDTEIELLMFDEVTNYISYLIEFVKPVKGVYIAIDGVAPMGKIKQQRQRRFKRESDTNLFNNIKKKHDISIEKDWNNNVVTPGTEFMEKLHQHFIKYIQKSTSNIIYSSYKSPGEGEHKLLDFIKKHEVNLNYVIYGLDADLIFLSLVTENKIYLLRENTEINKFNSVELILVDIDKMKKYIFLTFETELKKYNYNLSSCYLLNIIHDFIFMCYLIGNDFLPHIVSLDVKQNGVEYLIFHYVKTFVEFNNEFLIKDNIVNINFFITFLKYLSLDEHDNLIHHVKYTPKNTKETDYEREIFRIENLQFKINDLIQLGKGSFNDYRKRFYKYYWDVDDDIEEFSKNLVEQYLIGLKWVTLYYFDSCPAWHWYYQFDQAPFLSDIYKYIKKIPFNKIKFVKKEPIEPLMQLMIVLPLQQSYLLPKTIQIKLSSFNNISYMYP